MTTKNRLFLQQIITTMEQQPTPETPKESPSFAQQLRDKLKEITQLQEDTDIETTISSVKKSADFKGPTMWILACAIIIASVGLNINSTAVIIGAMLISPLMGPILGIGLAIGTTDKDLLRKSLINWGIMVFISLLFSSLYFLISPLNDARSELLARTSPTIFDVIIAFFGGAAGIIATSRKEQSFTIISGVAIATAIMPPLCTAGYGLATGQIHYFLGAFYLFFLNSFFIALATFIMVRYLHFPYVQYMDPHQRKLVKRTISIFAVLVIVPSIFMAINVIQESQFQYQTNKFVNEIQQTHMFDDTQVLSAKKEFHRKGSLIQLSLIGRALTQDEISQLQMKLDEYGIKKTKLEVKQKGHSVNMDISVQANIIENLLAKRDSIIAEKDSIIQLMEQDITLQERVADSYEQIAREIALQFPFVKNFSINNSVQVDVKTTKAETFPTLIVTYNGKTSDEDKQQFFKWMKVRLATDNLHILER